MHNKLEPLDPMTIRTLNKWTTNLGGLGNINKKNLNSNSNITQKTYYNLSFPKRLPQWIKYDKNVLKFIGYFTEHVVESAYENYRIRKCNIFYYLDDDTMHIDEIREENSGIIQGYFIKRQRCEKEGFKNNFINWRDFNLRQDIFLFCSKSTFLNLSSKLISGIFSGSPNLYPCWA